MLLLENNQQQAGLTVNISEGGCVPAIIWSIYCSSPCVSRYYRDHNISIISCTTVRAAVPENESPSDQSESSILDQYITFAVPVFILFQRNLC